MCATLLKLYYTFFNAIWKKYVNLIYTYVHTSLIDMFITCWLEKQHGTH